MKKIVLNFSWLLLLLLSSLGTGHATSIIPFHDLGEMTKASTIVVLATAGAKEEVQAAGMTNFQTPLTVQFVVKGDITTGDQLFLKHWSAKGEGWVMEVPDDVELMPNETYLLFLAYSGDGGLRPMLVSYGIFQQYSPGDGQHFLVPSLDWSSLNIINPSDGRPVEPLGVYRQADLLQQLYDVAHKNIQWEQGKSLETLDVSAFLGYLTDRVPPSHCSFAPLRWVDFPGTALPVMYSSAGDASCTPPTLANTYVLTATLLMEVSYLGINLTDGGTYSGFVPDCAGGTAAGGNFLTSFPARSLVVQYNDPCNQIPDLSGCSGTLGIGGLYGTSPTYMYDGATYFQGQHGYVIVNNGACCLSPTDYPLFLAHEMTHALGVNHITAGPANMNPSCCTPITALDITCLDYFYPLALPVELMDFRGVAASNAIQLEWSTASELNNLKFEVERSENGKDFLPIASLEGNGTTSNFNEYSFMDRFPLHGLNYYRLRQTDTDGSYVHSQVIAVPFGGGAPGFKAVPNPILDANLQLQLENQLATEGEIMVMNLQGTTLVQQPIQLAAGSNFLEINLPPLPAGQYFVKLIVDGAAHVTRFVKR